MKAKIEALISQVYTSISLEDLSTILPTSKEEVNKGECVSPPPPFLPPSRTTKIFLEILTFLTTVIEKNGWKLDAGSNMVKITKQDVESDKSIPESSLQQMTKYVLRVLFLLSFYYFPSPPSELKTKRSFTLFSISTGMLSIWTQKISRTIPIEQPRL